MGRPRKSGAQRSSRQILLGARRDNTNGTANRDYAKFMLFNHINIVLALELRVESISEVDCGAPKAWEPVFNGRVSLALPGEVSASLNSVVCSPLSRHLQPPLLS